MITLLAVAFGPVCALACGDSTGTRAVGPTPPSSTDDAGSGSVDAGSGSVDAGSGAADSGTYVNDAAVVDTDATNSCTGALVDDFENTWSSAIQWDGNLDTGTGTSTRAASGPTSAQAIRFATSRYFDTAGLVKNVSGACPLSLEAMVRLVSGANNDNLVTIALGLADGRSLDVKLVREGLSKAVLSLSDTKTTASSGKSFPSAQWTKVVLDYAPTTGNARVTVGGEVWANLTIAPSAVTNVRIGIISCSNTSEGAEGNELFFDDVAIHF